MTSRQSPRGAAGTAGCQQGGQGHIPQRARLSHRQKLGDERVSLRTLCGEGTAREQSGAGLGEVCPAVPALHTFPFNFKKLTSAYSIYRSTDTELELSINPG